MSDCLSNLLAERPWLLADGATGTNFFTYGLAHGDAPDIWNLEWPDAVVKHYRSFIEAGADIILTNSFGGTRNRLKLHKAEDDCFEINRMAAKLARQAIDECGRSEVVIAGSMGPTGDLFEPLGPLTFDQGAAAFAEQAKGLAAGGADVLWIETISSVDELRAAVQGGAESGIPAVTTLSFDTNGRTMMGVTPAQLAVLTRSLGPRPIAYGANCGSGAAELMAAMVHMTAAAEEGEVLVAKSNCGIPEFVDGEIQYNGTPEIMADYARLAIDCGVRIIGGCCGTSPEHIVAMRSALEVHEKGPRPSLEEITSRLGEISQGATTPLGDRPEPERGGRRRGGRRKGRAASDTPPRF